MRKIPLQLEDWLHLAALTFFYGQLGGTFASVAFGAGHPTTSLTKSQFSRFQQTLLARQVLYAIDIGLVKFSICVLLMRIFVNRGFRLAAICIMVLSGLWMVSTVLVGLLMCRPIQANWDPEIPGAICGKPGIAYMFIAVVNVFLEICLLILPIPMLWKLQLARRDKFGLTCVFASGLLYVSPGALDDLQHQIWHLTLDGTLHKTSVPATLKSILDVGTSTGSWAVAMARAYPGAKVIATDFMLPDITNAPHNLTILQQDVNSEWPFKHDEFELVHDRMLMAGIHDWPDFLAKSRKHLILGGRLKLPNVSGAYQTEKQEANFAEGSSFIRFSTLADDI
ncbi:hypothetical protein F5B20DRAFT_578648 [Whalleya microplaca]|nr:hypothetical protein F5B20DRAFT_578648 [Whalleya microplaca]